MFVQVCLDKKFSDTEGNLLILIPDKMEKKHCILPHTMAQKIYYHFRRGYQGLVRNKWTKSRPKHSRVNSKSCSSVPSVKGLDCFLSRCVEWDTPLSGWLPSLYATLFGRYQYDSTTSLDRQCNSWLFFTASHKGFLVPVVFSGHSYMTGLLLNIVWPPKLP